jgi:aryl-alcohol dehydrogenase-like predicted oxidoreductase
MEYRSLGKTGIRVSQLGMGCSSIGKSLYGHGEAEALATLAESLEQGVNFFDTAPGYGSGESEILIGRAFRHKRERVVLASKVGVRRAGVTHLAKKFKHRLKPVAGLLRPFYGVLPRIYRAERRIDYSPEFILASVEGSLARLGTDHLDLLQLHYPTLETLARGEFCEPFAQLKRQGKVRAFGASVTTTEEALACLQRPEIDAVQLPLSLVDQQAIGSFLPLAREKQVGVIARLVFAQGLLLGAGRDSKAARWLGNPQLLKQRQALAEEYRFLQHESRSLAQAALLFVRELPGVSTCIPGYGCREHLRTNRQAFDLPPLTAEEREQIEKLAARRA